MSGLRNGDST